jgi:hypothetical protein
MAVASSPEGLDSEQAAQFEQIRRRFVAGLAKRRLEIEAAPGAIELQAALHRLAGVAGGFDCAELGDIARQALQASHARDAGALAATLVRLEAEIDRLLTQS